MIKKIYIFGIITFLLFSCEPVKYEYLKLGGYTQGSTYSIVYENANSRNYQNDIDSILHTIDISLSVYDSTSVISRINANDPEVYADAYLKEILKLSFQVYNESFGDFDITVGPLVKAWGFGPDNALKRSNANIDSLRTLIGMDKISLVNNKLVKKNPKMILDVNAIAQGYTVDVVCKFFDSCHIKNYLVEIGGEVRGKGKNAKGEFWKIGIDKPVDGNRQGESISAIIELKNLAVSTSGNYRKFYLEKGVKYSHEIDPHTGYPARNTLLSSSILAINCALADAYATATMVMGLEKSKDFLKNHPEINAILIYTNDKGEYCEYVTKGIKDILKQ